MLLAQDITSQIPLVSSTRAQRGSRSPLGSNTKSASPEGPRLGPPGLEGTAVRPEVQYSRTQIKPGSDELHLDRQRRFKLQETAGQLLPEFRVSFCGRRRRRAVDEIKIMKGDDGAAYASGVQRCGSVWVCEACSRRIAAARRLETITALAQWRSQGGHVSMMTLTLPHKREHKLKHVLLALSDCTSYLNSGKRALSALLKPYGYFGQIRALEVTNGLNGWHPHLHVLVLHRLPIPYGVQDVLKARWEAAAIRHHWAPPGWSVGLSWQDGTAAADYVNKSGTWGLAEEVSQSHLKQAGRGGRSPHQLLLAATLGDKKAGALFAEFGHAFKGKRQLFWSAGLKAHFGLGDVSDEEIADSEDAPVEAEPLAVIPADKWALVCKYRQRAELLRAAECDGDAQVTVDFMLSWLFDRHLESIRRVA